MPSNNLRNVVTPVVLAVGLLWLIQLANQLLDLRLQQFGVYPRSVEGLIGVLFAPLIHGSWAHLFSNTPPLLVLGSALRYGYPRTSVLALPLIYLGSGLGVWIWGRESFHFGASGVTHALMLLIFLLGILRWDRPAIALACIAFFLYGGMLMTVLPRDPSISFESHLFGALTGAILAFVFKERDPRAPEKRYSWELEEESESMDWEQEDQLPRS